MVSDRERIWSQRTDQDSVGGSVSPIGKFTYLLINFWVGKPAGRKNDRSSKDQTGKSRKIRGSIAGSSDLLSGEKIS